jgi:hypothetical protein
MTSSTDQRIQQLTQKMLRKKLYVVLSKGGNDPGRLKEFIPAHLEYMIGLEKKGILFASGPLSDSSGVLRGDGLTILRTASVEEARKIAEADPFIVNGLRTFDIKEWTLMEGSFGFKVNFSDQSIEVA